MAVERGVDALHDSPLLIRAAIVPQGKGNLLPVKGKRLGGFYVKLCYPWIKTLLKTSSTKTGRDILDAQWKLPNKAEPP